MQRSEVVENPNGPSLRRNHQILAMNLDISNRHVWQVQLKRLPALPVIERDKHPEFSAGVEQSFTIRILAHDTRGPIRGNAVLAVSQPGPGVAVIVSEIDVRLIVAEQPAIDGVISRALAMRRRFDKLHAPAGGRSFGVMLVHFLPLSRVI